VSSNCPDESSGELHGREKVACGLVASGSDGVNELELGKEVPDQVAPPDGLPQPISVERLHAIKSMSQYLPRLIHRYFKRKAFCSLLLSLAMTLTTDLCAELQSCEG
jgi:hypothetical protein